MLMVVWDKLHKGGGSFWMKWETGFKKQVYVRLERLLVIMEHISRTPSFPRESHDEKCYFSSINAVMICGKIIMTKMM